MLGAKVDLEVNFLITLNTAMGGGHSVVRLFILQRDLGRVLLFIDAPVIGHYDGRGVLNTDGPLDFAGGVCVVEVNGFEGVLLEVHFLAIHCYDV